MAVRLIVMDIAEVGHWVVGAHFGEAFIEGVGDDIMISRLGRDDPIEEGFEFKACAHPPQLKVSKPEFSVGETCLLAIEV
jgi:hypothetical protein